MPQFQDKSISSLSAGQAAGTAVCVAADSSRTMLILGNPGANAMLVNFVTGAGAGVGLPLPAGSVLAFGKDLPCPTNDIFILGTAADKLTVWVA